MRYILSKRHCQVTFALTTASRSKKKKKQNIPSLIGLLELKITQAKTHKCGVIKMFASLNTLLVQQYLNSDRV